MTRPMKGQHRTFLAEYLTNGKNATQAAIAAGYSPKNAANQGQRLIHDNVHIVAAIAQEEGKAQVRTGITKDKVLNSAWELSQRCLQKVPVTDRQGDQVMDEDTGMGVWKFDSGGAAKGLELVAKLLNLFPAPNSKVQVSLDTQDGALSDDLRGRKIARRLILEEIRESEERGSPEIAENAHE